MDNRLRRRDNNRKGLVDRLDRATRDVNMFLLVLAIGLATLDFTVFCAVKVTTAMPPPHTVAAQAAIPARPAASAAAAAAVPAVAHRY